MSEIPNPPPNPGQKTQAEIDAEYAGIKPIIDASTVPDSVPLAHQETGAGDIFKPVIEIKRGENREFGEKFPPMPDVLLSKVDEIRGVEDLYPVLDLIRTSNQEGTLVGEYYDSLKVRIAEKMTRVLVRAAKASTLDPEIIGLEMRKYASYSYLSPEQVQTVEAAIRSRSEFNLATASLVDIHRKYGTRGNLQNDIDNIDDPTYLMFIAESIDDQIRGGGAIGKDGRREEASALDSATKAYGEGIIYAISERMLELKNPMQAAMRRISQKMEKYLRDSK